MLNLLKLCSDVASLMARAKKARKVQMESKPVPGEESGQRGSGDPVQCMQCFIRPNFPDNIQGLLKTLDDDLKEDIKALFNYHHEEFGDLLFTAEDYKTLNMCFI